MSALCLFAYVNHHSGRSYKSSPHRHPCTELIYNTGESGWLYEEERKWRYLPNQVLVYQPGPSHWSQVDDGDELGCHICIGVEGGGAEEVSTGVFHADQDLILLFKMIEDTLQRGREATSAPERLNLLAALVCLSLRDANVRAAEAQEPAQRARLAKELIDARFMEDLSIDELASNVYISGDHLRYLFRKEYGVGPIHYLLRKRIEYARTLLRNTDLKIYMIAHRCGFEDPYYFSRLFRKLSGASPQEYRRGV